MPVAAALTDAELHRVADDVLRVAMQNFQYEGVEVTSAPDWSDEPSIHVFAKVGAGVPPLDGPIFSRVHGALHEALLALGEERFPYFRLRRADDQMPDDDAPAAGAP